MPPRRLAGRLAVGTVGTILFLVTATQIIEIVWPAAFVPGPLIALGDKIAPLRSANHYGLFAVMTTERTEISVEGSDDGETWKAYRFWWKPQEPGRRPRFTTPHMPRLDWQMWFAALTPDCRYQPWFVRFEDRLLEGSPAVLRLLRENPFPGKPPRFIRARTERYRFTTWGARDWWRTSEPGVYCPEMER